MKYFDFIKRDIYLKSIIYNRFFLYFVLFASLINMTAYGLMGDIITPLIFILVGVITAYYNKNMLVILLTSLVFSNIVKYGNKLAINMEGFADGADEMDTAAAATTDATATDDSNTKFGQKTPSSELDTTSNETDGESGSLRKLTAGLNKTNNMDSPSKQVRVIKEELDTLLLDLESKINTINNDINELQKTIKKKASENTK